MNDMDERITKNLRIPTPIQTIQRLAVTKIFYDFDLLGLGATHGLAKR